MSGSSWKFNISWGFPGKNIIPISFPRNSPGNIKYARKLSESENGQITLFFQRYSIFKELIGYFKCLSLSKPYSHIGNIPFPQCVDRRLNERKGEGILLIVT